MDLNDAPIWLSKKALLSLSNILDNNYDANNTDNDNDYDNDNDNDPRKRIAQICANSRRARLYEPLADGKDDLNKTRKKHIFITKIKAKIKARLFVVCKAWLHMYKHVKLWSSEYKELWIIEFEAFIKN